MREDWSLSVVSGVSVVCYTACFFIHSYACSWLIACNRHGRLPWRPGAQHSRRHLGHRSRSWCCYRPWAAHVTMHGPLSLRLQPATPALTSSPIIVRECHQDACPDVHLVSSGLLQLTAVRHRRRTTSTPTVGAERCRPLVTGARECDHITPVLRQLHWLPVRQRIVFKIAALRHQSLVGAAPAYLANNCRLLSDVGRCPLQSNSNDMRKLLVPRTHNKLGDSDRSFSAAGPRLWNDIPPGLWRLWLTFDSFRQSLRTHLFGDRSA